MPTRPSRHENANRAIRRGMVVGAVVGLVCSLTVAVSAVSVLVSEMRVAEESNVDGPAMFLVVGLFVLSLPWALLLAPATVTVFALIGAAVGSVLVKCFSRQ